MKKWLLLFALVFLIFSCKNNSTEKKNESDKSAIEEYVNTLSKQVLQKPDSVGLRFKYLTALDSIGNYKQALAQIDSLLLNDKGNYALWFKKGQINEHAGDTLDAIEYYNKALNIYPAPDGLLALANLYAETKNPLALKACKKLDEMRLGREYDAYTAFFAGVYYERTGNKEKALELFDRSIDNNYTFMDAYMEKGYLYFDSKNYSQAMNAFNTAIQVNNRYADAYYWEGKCFEATNKKTEALTKYQQAFQLNNNLIEAQTAVKRLQ